MKTKKCPICNTAANLFVNWPYTDFDGSPLNYAANLYNCENCGLIFVGNIEDEELNKYYSDHCLYANASGIGVGGESKEDLQRYSLYKKMFNDINIPANFVIADIGCSRGGWLKYLSKQENHQELWGIDIDKTSLPISTDSISFKQGGALLLPFSEKIIDLVTYFHVIEHIINLQQVIKEAYQVLKDDGYIMIEVPDAERYSDSPVGTGFWMSIKEHVNHFSCLSLVNLLKSNHLSIKQINRTILPIKNSSYPSLLVLAQKTKNTSLDFTDICHKNVSITTYITTSRDHLSYQADKIINFAKKFNGTTFWGCSYELFTLLPYLQSHLNLEKTFFCDSDPAKQGKTIQGKHIVSAKNLSTEGSLIICSYSSKNEIYKIAISLGWSQEQIYQLH